MNMVLLIDLGILYVNFKLVNIWLCVIFEMLIIVVLLFVIIVLLEVLIWLRDNKLRMIFWILFFWMIMLDLFFK